LRRLNEMNEEPKNNLELDIIKQVEYYLSPQNLRSDAFLVSKMDAQHYVSLNVIAEFKLLKNITEDLDLIKDALKKSNKVELKVNGDSTLVRPLTTSTRTTIVLRDIPSDVPEEEIKTIFPENASIKNMKPDIGNTWFITFETEEQCQAAFEHCREKEFRGSEVKARIKSESVSKTLTNETTQSQTITFQAQPIQVLQAYPFVQQYAYLPYPQEYPGQFVNGGRGRGRGRGNRDKGNSQGQGRGEKAKQSAPQKPVAQPSVSSPSDFPPLPSTNSSGGYSKSFRKFTKQDIISVLSSLQNLDIPLPSDVPPNCPVVVPEINRDIELLRVSEESGKQKSFVEAAITAKDIKAPEKGVRRLSKRGSRNSRNSPPTAEEVQE
jgi:la-related protein 4